MSGIRTQLVAVTLTLGFSAAALAGSARVSFLNPEKFTDIGRYGDQREAAANQSEIARHIEQLAASKLPADQSLQVDVLDVDLAGHVEFWRRMLNEVRIMREATWPSVKLRYKVTQDGQVVTSGEETVSDMNYLDGPNPYPDSDPLRYEKRMLDQWLTQRLVEHRPPLR
jgi:hypothetical protein